MGEKKAFVVQAVKEKRAKAFAAWDVREQEWRANFEDNKKRKAAEAAWKRYQKACVEVFDAVYA
jgi:hypothetical protein